jgi:hypothetical protein
MAEIELSQTEQGETAMDTQPALSNLARMKRALKRHRAAQPVMGPPAKAPPKPAKQPEKPAKPPAERPEQPATHSATAKAPEAPKAAKPKKKKSRPPADTAPKFRLPNGSTFELRFNAAAAVWTGTLTIPGDPPLVFSGTQNAVHWLVHKLGRQCAQEAAERCNFGDGPKELAEANHGMAAISGG